MAPDPDPVTGEEPQAGTAGQEDHSDPEGFRGETSEAPGDTGETEEA